MFAARRLVGCTGPLLGGVSSLASSTTGRTEEGEENSSSSRLCSRPCLRFATATIPLRIGIAGVVLAEAGIAAVAAVVFFEDVSCPLIVVCSGSTICPEVVSILHKSRNTAVRKIGAYVSCPWTWGGSTRAGALRRAHCSAGGSGVLCQWTKHACCVWRHACVLAVNKHAGWELSTVTTGALPRGRTGGSRALRTLLGEGLGAGHIGESRAGGDCVRRVGSRTMRRPSMCPRLTLTPPPAHALLIPQALLTHHPRRPARVRLGSCERRRRQVRVRD